MNSFESPSTRKIMDRIKHDSCFVSVDEKSDTLLCDETTYFSKQYQLPDGYIIKIDKERFMCCNNVMFNGMDGNFNIGKNLYHLFYNNVNNHDSDTKDIISKYDKEMYIVLAGGNTMMKGFSTKLRSRLAYEWSKDPQTNEPMWGKTNRIVVNEPHIICQQFAAVVGGSLVADFMKYDEEFG